MLEIKLKDTLESLDTGGVTINTFSDSSLFSAKINNSTISYNFTVTYTDKNARLLNLPAEIESADSFDEFEVFLVIENSNEIEALLTIQEVLVNKTGTFIRLKLDASDLPTDLLTDQLSNYDYGDDIDIGPDTSDVEDHVIDANTKGYDETSHVFPMVYNENFYDGDNSEWLNCVNNFDISTGTMVANTDTPSTKNKNVLVPYFFMLFILEQIFESNGITLTGTFVNHAEIRKLIVHNNYSLDEFDITKSFVRASLTSDQAVPAPYVSSTHDRTLILDDDSTAPNEDTGGVYNTATGAFVVPQEGILNISLYNLGVTMFCDSTTNIWRFYIQVYIDGVFRASWDNWTDGYQHLVYFGRKDFSQIDIPTINLTASDIGKTGYIKFGFLYCDTPPSGYDVATIHSGVIAEMNFDKWSDYNVYSKTISPANHVPNMTAETFINAYMEAFRVLPVYDKKNKELSLNFFEDLYTSTEYDDVTGKVESHAIKTLNYTGFKVNYDLSADELFPASSPGTSQYIDIGEYATPSDLPTPASVSLLAYVQSENAYYLSKVTTGITFERYKESFDDLIVGDGDQDYVISWAPFLMKYQEIDNDGSGTMREFLLPNISEVGSSLYFEMGINDPQFKTLIWHGMVDGPTATQPYPFASSYNIDHNGNDIGDLTLRLVDQEKSIHYEFLKNYFDWLMTTKKVEFNHTKDLSNPLSYDFFKKKLYINQRYLTGKLKLKIGDKGVESIVAENYKV